MTPGCQLSRSLRCGGGQRWIDQKKLVPGSFDNPEFIEACRVAQRLATQYFQNGCLGMSHTESQMQFFTGRAAMIPCGAWLKSEMLGKIPDGFELGCFNLPVPKNSIAEPWPSTPAEFSEFLKTETARLGKLVREAGIRAD